MGCNYATPEPMLYADPQLKLFTANIVLHHILSVVKDAAINLQ